LLNRQINISKFWHTGLEFWGRYCK